MIMSKMPFRTLVAVQRFSLPMLAAAAVVTFAGNAAHAAGYPTKLGPATWTGVANNSNIYISISGQGAAVPCAQIIGYMGNKGAAPDSTIEGSYCPATGKLTFLRKSKTNGVSFQSYVGYMAQADGVHVPHMGGMFSQLVNPGIGDYGFYAYQGPVAVP
jgi:hypothetical protein